jgi:hypothetical protein
MKDLECSVHGTALVEKEVPVFYGMPTPDSDIFGIGSKFPHHGLWTIGGCDVSDDSPETEIALVCADCHDAAQKLEGDDLSPKAEAPPLPPRLYCPQRQAHAE